MKQGGGNFQTWGSLELGKPKSTLMLISPHKFKILYLRGC